MKRKDKNLFTIENEKEKMYKLCSINAKKYFTKAFIIIARFSYDGNGKKNVKINSTYYQKKNFYQILTEGVSFLYLN